ncbi:MAG: shikimate dehydrogenase [Eubacterium sp.]|nr:shikimate dehydrogenase [Eubacterium sp.]
MIIRGTTQLTALLGHPAAHSISPLMHNEAFSILGLDYVYLAFDVPPVRLKAAVEGLKAIGIKGFNLTMPHKTAIIEYLDELTAASRLCGAVNTVVNHNGRLIGHTTDGTGYMRSVSDAGYQIIGKTMTILGAGGAATAICTQAALDGMKEIHIFKRNNATFQKTADFAENLTRHTKCSVQVFDLADTLQLKKSLAESVLLTNATNVGMEPDTNESLITDPGFFHPDLIVSDIIYHPRETRLMKLAKEAGCPAMNGLYMLLFQGAASFEYWTGREMPIEPIRQKYFNNREMTK